MIDILELAGRSQTSIRIGTLTGLDSEGRPLVECGAGTTPRAARTIVDLDPQGLAPPVPVLLCFAEGEPESPIILGIVRSESRLQPKPAERSFRVDGREMKFEATQSLELKCGRGSITLKADGEIVVRGVRLTQRASSTNVIQGATVQIN